MTTTDTTAPDLTVPNPGCPSGPQGFHLYDLTQAGTPQIHCLECGVPKTEMQILVELATYEPPHGSVILQDGPQGTAWQRFYGHGSWKSVTGRTSAWEAVLERSRPGSRVWLIYVPHNPRR